MRPRIEGEKGEKERDRERGTNRERKSRKRMGEKDVKERPLKDVREIGRVGEREGEPGKTAEGSAGKAPL